MGFFFFIYFIYFLIVHHLLWVKIQFTYNIFKHWITFNSLFYQLPKHKKLNILEHIFHHYCIRNNIIDSNVFIVLSGSVISSNSFYTEMCYNAVIKYRNKHWPLNIVWSKDSASCGLSCCISMLRAPLQRYPIILY